MRMGLINRLMPFAELESYVRDYAETIGHNAPLTLKAAKLASAELLKDEEHRDLDLVQHAVNTCFNSEDYQEGRLAFMEKRKPMFQGR
jgi:1,4-dihydroxy-2-naphthoyl-CoA synthase